MRKKNPMFFVSLLFGTTFTLSGIMILVLVLTGETSPESSWGRFVVIASSLFFLIIGLFFLVKFFFYVKNIFQKRKILKKGKTTTAHYLGSIPTGSVNGAMIYKISFSWEKDGEFKNDITNETFYQYEVNYLENKGEFEIYYLDDKVAVGNIVIK